MKINGVVHVTGEHDVGKTTFCLEYGVAPERVAFFDDDIKGRGTVAQLQSEGFKMGMYVDLVALGEKKTELVFHDEVLKRIEKIKKGDFDAIVWDTWTGFASTCHPYVMRHATEFKTNWSPKGTIKGAQQWQEARRYEAILLNRLMELVPTVFIVSHLKDHYINDAKVPGKSVPAGSSVLERVPTLRLWLRQNPSGRPVPIALVLKRLDRKIFVPGKGIRTVNVLPRKIVPRDEDHSLWDTINWYWENPYGDAVNEKDMPDEYELSILDGTLTKDQTRTFMLMLEGGMAEREEEETVAVQAMDEEVAAQVQAMSAEGKKAPEIAMALGLTVADVLKELRSRDEVQFMKEKKE